METSPLLTTGVSAKHEKVVILNRPRTGTGELHFVMSPRKRWIEAISVNLNTLIAQLLHQGTGLEAH